MFIKAIFVNRIRMELKVLGVGYRLMAEHMLSICKTLSLYAHSHVPAHAHTHTYTCMQTHVHMHTHTLTAKKNL